MASTVIVKVKVEELSKYGFKANGKYVGLSKQLPEADKTRLVPGAEFEAEYYVADSGKEYLNKILNTVQYSVKVEQNATGSIQPDTARAKHFTPKFTKTEKSSDAMSKDEWAAKDRRISRQGCIQVAVQVAGDFEKATALADKMLEYVNK